MSPLAPDHLDLAPIGRVSGTVRLPGSKSISNRVLLLAALAHGETLVRDLLDSDDTAHMLQALGKLGVSCTPEAGRDYRVTGVGGAFPVKAADLFLGNAGTAVRPLTAALACSGGRYRLSGVPRMHERPIRDLVDTLRELGADIKYLGQEGYPPLEIGPAALARGVTARVRGDTSSQFVTALLMALPLIGGGTITIDGDLVSKPYVEMTLNLMRRFGVTATRADWSRFQVPGAYYRSPGEIHVEGDASSASYFLAAGAISGTRGAAVVRVEGVGRSSIQGDVRFTEVLERMGATVRVGDRWIEATAPAGSRLHALDADLNHIPDAAMTAAIVALFADGPSVLRNIGNLRVKETDRLAALATELRKLGAEVEEGADHLGVTPPRDFRPATIDTYDDHRMAMCFSLAALGGVAVRINNPGCVRKTFPDYFDEFLRLAVFER
ncbi:MAG TPA: 3-phosphoshikimate 1-carboxyvinyltransferase [Candidatus Methylomirabilis sp.]|nr:3-phosphoshikimate 1-carboxyvinyltransferase [Candidatus Methylomirabilis sp.]